MLESFKWFAELLKEALAYLELDEGYAPEEIRSVEVEHIQKGHCIVTFPEIGVQYFASNWNHWSGKDADWLFSR